MAAKSIEAVAEKFWYTRQEHCVMEIGKKRIGEKHRSCKIRPEEFIRTISELTRKREHHNICVKTINKKLPKHTTPEQENK